MHLICFDTETTGLDVQKEHIIQLSLVKFETETWSVLDQRDWYILPEGEFEIPAEAEAVHHISKTFLLENGVSLRSVYDELIAFTNGCDILSYNASICCSMSEACWHPAIRVAIPVIMIPFRMFIVY